MLASKAACRSAGVIISSSSARMIFAAMGGHGSSSAGCIDSVAGLRARALGSECGAKAPMLGGILQLVIGRVVDFMTACGEGLDLVNRSALGHPLGRLSGNGGDVVEVCVVVQDGERRGLGDGCDEEIRHLASAETIGGEPALDL